MAAGTSNKKYFTFPQTLHQHMFLQKAEKMYVVILNFFLSTLNVLLRTKCDHYNLQIIGVGGEDELRLHVLQLSLSVVILCFLIPYISYLVRTCQNGRRAISTWVHHMTSSGFLHVFYSYGMSKTKIVLI